MYLLSIISHINADIITCNRTCMQWYVLITVDREIFAFKYFRVINVRVSNFHHKVQEVKIIHCVFIFVC